MARGLKNWKEQEGRGYWSLVDKGRELSHAVDENNAPAYQMRHREELAKSVSYWLIARADHKTNRLSLPFIEWIPIKTFSSFTTWAKITFYSIL